MGRSLRVLIVEDSEDDTLLLAQKLRRAGYEPTYKRVDTATDMIEAVDQGPWDIILCDYSMPQFNGRAALEIVKKKGVDVPFIIVSGTVGEDVAVDAMKAGAHDYVMKDRLQRLIPAIKRELADAEVRREHKRAEDALRRADRALKVLSECNQTVIRAVKESELLHEICRIIVEVGGYCLAWVGFADEDGEKLVRPVGHAGVEAEYLERTHVTWNDTARDSDPTGTAIRTGKPCVARDILTDSHYNAWRAEATERGFASSIALPLISEGRTLGALNIYAKEPDAFDTEEVELLMELSGDLAYGLMTLRSRAERNRVEKALKESERKLSTLIGNLQGMAYRCLNDQNWTMEFISEGCHELTGYAPDDIISNRTIPFNELIHPDDRQAVWDQIQKAVGDKRAFHLEYRIKTRAGQEKWVSEQGVGVFSDDGDLIALEGFINDITERKQAEEALQKSESFTRAVMDNLPIGVAVNSVDPAVDFVYMNDNFPKFYRTTRAALDDPDAFWDSVYEDPVFREEIKKRVLNDCAIGDPERMHWKDVPITRKGEETFFISARNIPVPGKQLMISTVWDVTERKRAEEALVQSERYYRSLLYSLHEDLLVIDCDYRVRDINNTALQTLGLKREEVVGRPCYKVSHGLDAPCHEHGEHCALREVFDTGKPCNCHHEHVKADGSRAHVNIMMSPMTDENGNITHVIEAARDVSDLIKAQDALQASERTYRLLADNTLDVIWTMNLDLEFTYVNPAILGLTGHLPEEWIGTRLPEHCDEENLAKMTRVIADEMAKGPHSSGVVIEAAILNKNREPIPIEINGKVIYDENGQPVSLQGTARDISERKRAEEMLRESEARYRSVFNNTGAATVIVEDDMTISMANAEFERLSGYPSKALEGKRKWTEFVAQEDVERMQEYHTARRERRNDAPTEYEFAFVDKQGHVKAVLVQVGVIPGSKRSVASLLDITARKHTEKALQQSEQKYRLLVENLTDLVVKVDPEGKFLFASPSYCQMFGMMEEELVGEKFVPLVHEDDREATAKAMEALYWPPHTVHREQRTMTKHGWRWLAWRDTAVLDAQGNVGAVIGVGRDITQTKRLQDQLRQAQKMEAIGTLSGGIAHDFNNILSAIVGYTEIALDDTPKGSLLESNLREVLEAGGRAKHLVKQILTFSRQTEHELMPVQVKPIAKEALKFLRASLPTTIEIEQDIQSDSSTLADPTQMHQVLLNLCTNAAQAIGEEGGSLRVSLRDVEVHRDFSAQHPGITPGPYLKLTVSDTGRGMAPEIMERIFEPFFTTKEREEGTGLGLSVVHGLIKSHGGTISVDSEPGKGTVFHVYLPRIASPVETAPVEAEKPLPTGGECILFVDDEAALVDIGRKMLEPLGYSIVTSTSSTEALELFRAEPERFDLIITDMTMPDMTGKELAERMKQIRPDIPIILCTGYSQETIVEPGQERTVRKVLLKPLERRNLADTIRKLLEEGRSET